MHACHSVNRQPRLCSAALQQSGSGFTVDAENLQEVVKNVQSRPGFIASICKQLAAAVGFIIHSDDLGDVTFVM